MLEISFVPRCDGEPVQACRSRDHDVVEKVLLLTHHHARGFAEAAPVHRKYRRRVLQFVDPRLNGTGFGCVLPTCALNALLEFAERDCRKANLFVPQATKPRDNRSVRPRFMNLRDYVCVEQIPGHSNSTGGRRFHFRRGGTMFSKRGPERSNSLMLGRDAFCRRRHSSIGTRTAASTPRRVTTWGPFFSAASRNSLNRAFASCTCQELTIALREGNVITSQMTSQSERILTDISRVITYNLRAPWPRDPAQRLEMTTAVAPDLHLLCREPHSLPESRLRRTPCIHRPRKSHAETTDGAPILPVQAGHARRPAAPGSASPDPAADSFPSTSPYTPRPQTYKP